MRTHTRNVRTPNLPDKFSRDIGRLTYPTVLSERGRYYTPYYNFDYAENHLRLAYVYSLCDIKALKDRPIIITTYNDIIIVVGRITVHTVRHNVELC